MRIFSIIQGIKRKRGVKQLDLLVRAAELMGMGVMLKGPDGLMSVNSFMESFARECGGLAGFDIGDDRYLDFSEAAMPKRTFRISKIRLPGRDEAIIVQDASEGEHAQKKMRHLANHDTLTGLANRPMFDQWLRRAAQRSVRYRQPMALLIVDLDHFKQINETFGHSAGDRVLVEAAKRMGLCIRDVDSLARVGGDEFYVLLENVDTEDTAVDVARRISNELAKPFDLDGHEARVGSSIGISITLSDEVDTDLLIRNADIAMHEVKHHERNNFLLFTPDMQDRLHEDLELGRQIYDALERKEFELYYQPQVEIKSGRIVGMEALLRWNHSEKGLISPAVFIPMLENTKLINPVGEWVFKEACRQNLLWQKKGLLHIKMAVNISPIQFYDKNLAGNIERIIVKTGIDPRYLDIEITEELFMEDIPLVKETLNRLKSIGIGGISMDDFGTGYSSLSYLKRFPVDAVKIDRIFVRDCVNDYSDSILISAIVAMARGLNLKETVAEGVEDEAQLKLLKEKGCDIYQGFLFSPPVPAREAEALLAKQGS
jgi:diguanylate cyclase